MGMVPYWVKRRASLMLAVDGVVVVVIVMEEGR